MRGLMVADHLLSRVQQEVYKNPSRAVREVHVRVGRYAFADIGELTSAWGLIVKDTPFAAARLVVTEADGRECTFTKVVFD